MDIKKQDELMRILEKGGITLNGCAVVFRRNEAAWLKGRHGIGGSDAAKTLGIHGSQAELWAQKCGYIQAKDISSLDVIQYGKKAEGLIAGIYELDHPDSLLIRYPYWSFCNRENPFMQYTPDGLVIDENGRLGILEIKTTTIRRGEDWDAWQNTEENFCVPDHYFCQILHGSNVIPEAEFVDLIALIRHAHGSALKTFRFEMSDPEVARQRDILKDYTCSFWESVEKKEYPKVTMIARPSLGLAV